MKASIPLILTRPFLLAVFVGGCTSFPLKTRMDQPSSDKVPQGGTLVAEGSLHTSKNSDPAAHDSNSENQSDKLTSPTQSSSHRLAIVLGPGGARSYAHIGFLRELQRRKIEPELIAGIEWSALPAALYASKGYPNEAEWQMFKLDEASWFRRQFLPGENKSVSSDIFREDLQKIFGSSMVQNYKIKFVCPSWNMSKSQTYLMNKGNTAALIPFCLSHPPQFRPHQNSVASLFDLRALADHLRSQGATHILYVNLLEGLGPSPFGDDFTANALWSGHLSALQRRQVGIDEIISIPLGEFSMRNFDKKKEILTAGQRRVEESLDRWIKKMGY